MKHIINVLVMLLAGVCAALSTVLAWGVLDAPPLVRGAMWIAGLVLAFVVPFEIAKALKGE